MHREYSSFFARNRWWIIAAAIVAAVVLLAAFNSMRGDIIPVRAAGVVRGRIRSLISTNGKIEPIQNFEAHSPVATTIKRILVKEGQQVKRGQLLMQLDDAEARTSAAKAIAQLRGAQADIHAVTHGGTREEVLTTDAQLVKAQADRDNAQRNLDAFERLQKDGAASAGEVRAAEAEYNTALANLNLLEQKRKARYSPPEVAKVEAQQSEAQAAYDAAQDILSKSNIRAPFDGVVYALPVQQGNYVSPGQLLLEEADLSKVRLRAFVDEPDVGRLAPGQKIEVKWDGLPGRVWRSSVAARPSTIELFGTRNVGEITTQLDNTDGKLLPNTNVTVELITAEHENVLIAPREAVRMDASKPYVYRIADDELHRREVETALSNLTQVEVTGGLSDKDLLALGPLNNKPMRDGQPVKVVY
ncbi:MAG: efflux transporter periplasmic adaptor subunit [Acidobacteria bacterium]|nr:MAG: efflux transporter periplasmic adaptor subunit [Acidobacteriota bacterium]PYY08828.1 MAG: efflux transporter periplasmic adaptor subunit [Acidobacteriota bacterium]